MSESPRFFHFVFGLVPQLEAFHLVHYLCLESCRQVNQPAAIFFHYRHLPYGPYWDKIAPHLTLCPVDLATPGFDPTKYQNSSEGRLIQEFGITYAHESDFIRLRALKEFGGVYADMDTLFVKPYPAELFNHSCVLGEERPLYSDKGLMEPSLCNAVIFSKADSRFLQTWSDLAVETFDGTWSLHSCQLATYLWRISAEDVHVVPEDWFFSFGSHRAGIEGLFVTAPNDTRRIFSIHLWAHLWWSEARLDVTDFHAGLVDLDYVKHANTTYASLARRFL